MPVGECGVNLIKKKKKKKKKTIITNDITDTRHMCIDRYTVGCALEDLYDYLGTRLWAFLPLIYMNYPSRYPAFFSAWLSAL